MAIFEGMFPYFPHYLYYVVVGLQVICVVHCLNRGNQRWIWLIVFLPLVGCIAYFFTEILPLNQLGGMQAGIGAIFNQAGRISRLEENLRFADTFNNRVMLADAYLSNGRTDEAIELYTSSLTGAFTENEHVLGKLIVAYFEKERFDEVLSLARKIYGRPGFKGSKAHILYARALELAGDPAGAEREFGMMKGRYAFFEARYQYGLFLQRAGRAAEAKNIFREIANESSHLGSRERRAFRTWIMRSKEELKRG
jgi:hypothetical protein